jgi:hypothetical protein
VTPGELERALRDCLSHRAIAAPGTAAPAGVDTAGRALRRARRLHRRRSVAGATMAALVTVLVSAAATQLAASHGGHPRPAFVSDPSASPFGPTVALSHSAAPVSGSTNLDRQPLVAMAPPPVDIVVATGLRSARGDLIDLSGIGAVAQAGRTPDGWLLVTTTASGRSTLWFATSAAAPRAVLSGVDAVVLAADAARVAWRHGPRVSVASIASGRLGTVEQITSADDGRPIRFVGAAVLLVREQSDVETDGYDLWWPGRGTYEPARKNGITGAYGLLPDGRTLVAQVSVPGAARPCLALLDTTKALAVIKRTCAVALGPGGRGAVSPNGRWLVANGVPGSQGHAAGSSGGAGEAMLVIDLDAAFAGRPLVEAVQPRLVGDVVWVDGGTLVHAGSQGDLVRVQIDPAEHGGKPHVERVTVPGVTAGDRLVVVGGCLADPARAARPAGPAPSASPVASCR